MNGGLHLTGQPGGLQIPNSGIHTFVCLILSNFYSMKALLWVTSIYVAVLLGGCRTIKLGRYCSYNDESISLTCIEILENGYYTQTFKSEGAFKTIGTGRWKRNSLRIELFPDSMKQPVSVDTVSAVVLKPLFLQPNKIVGAVSYKGKRFKQVFIVSK